ncbi:MAG: transglycosylase SLT domain-containing protein [Solirubrobacterales bacterium]
MTAPVSVNGSEGPQPARETRVAGHIRDAAASTGVPFEFLLAQAKQESRLNPDAQNARSSAAGLFQFTKSTWLAMVKQHGAAHGLEKYSDAITKGAGGYTVKDPALKKEILELRRDPKVSALMAGEYAKDNGKVLQAKLGRPASAHDLYLAHFLGAGGAARVIAGLQAGTLNDAAGALPDAARANPDLFLDPESGTPRSLASLYKVVQRRYERAVASVRTVAREVRPEVDLAALRPAERPAAGPGVQPDPLPQLAAAPSEPARSAFANAVEPTSPFFPVALPPSPVTVPRTGGGPTLRLMIQAMEDGKA